MNRLAFWTLVVWVGVILLWSALVLWAWASRAYAQEATYTADDTVLAIHQYSAEFGVSEAWMLRTVECETAGTFSNYLVGRQGELGAAQLHPRGELLRFYAWGYDDPTDPYQSIRFMAQEFSFGRASRWACS